MSLWQSLVNKLGLRSVRADRHPIRVFLLDDDKRRHRWFSTRFKGDFVDIASNVAEARELLRAGSYDAIFLDHDLHPEHYHAESTDDERTGYAVARAAGPPPPAHAAPAPLTPPPHAAPTAPAAWWPSCARPAAAPITSRFRCWLSE